MELEYHINRIYSKLCNPSYREPNDVSIKLSNMELAAGSLDGPARRITELFRDRRYGDCATLIRQLSDATIIVILSDIPISAFHNALPQSLVILEVIYAKVYNYNFKVFPIDLLCSEQFLEVLVAFFSRQYENSNRAAKNCNSYFPLCRNILSVILVVKPEFRNNLKQKKRKLDNCVLHLGHHGMVEASNGRCLHIQDSLKIEVQNVISLCKALIQKIEEFGATHKQTSVKGGASDAASASHQRLLQMTKVEVQDRIIRNKTVFHLAEPANNNAYLRQVINLLEKRVNYDKQALFHYNELRKLGSECRDDGCVSALLRQFSQGYATVLQLMNDVSAENQEDCTLDSDSDEEMPMVPFSKAHRNTSLSLNGLSLKRHGGNTVPDLHSRLGASSTIDRRIPSNSVSALRKLEQPVSTKHHARVAVGNNSATVMSISQPSINGITAGMRSTDDVRSALTNGTTPSMKASGDGGSTMSDPSMRPDMQRELRNLRLELETAKNAIQMLHHREAQLRERLSEQAQKHFTVSNHHFENLSLGDTRPTELIRRYGDLYTDGRIDALNALDSLPELNELNDLKGKLLFSAVVLAFRSAQNSCKELKTKVMRLLQLPSPETSQVTDSVSIEMQAKLDEYLQKTVHRYDISVSLEEVSSQIYSTLFDYPSLRACRQLQSYLQECVRVAWSLSTQSPPYTILYDSQIFDPSTHARFHSSDPESHQIKAFLWPALLEGTNGPCVQRGMVLT